VGDTIWPKFPVNNGEELLLHYGIPIEIRSPLMILNIIVHFVCRDGVRKLIISSTYKNTLLLFYAQQIKFMKFCYRPVYNTLFLQLLLAA
jgi:hypothetical protein